MIVAAATPWGRGATALVRVSGRGADAVVRRVCGRVPAPWTVRHARLRDEAGVFDSGLVAWFAAPKSYTGEDVAEISCHGNPLLVERLVAALCAAGARVASPGEFTRRALVSGKLDLTQAEAVLDTIAATSMAGVDAARARVDGAVSAFAASLRDELVDLAATLEVAVDYPDEEGMGADSILADRLLSVATRARRAAGTVAAGRAAVEGVRVALVGPVNAGKSSLFNALLGRARAIVSPVPGTTRDVVEAPLQTRTARVSLLDTAGDREGADPVEVEGVRLGREAAAEVDLLLLCIPGDRAPAAEWDALWRRSRGRPLVAVRTFTDRPPDPACDAWAAERGIVFAFAVSASTGVGVDALRSGLPSAVGTTIPAEAEVVLASRRQADALAALAEDVAEAARALRDGAGPVVAIELTLAGVGHLDRLVGRDSREAVLDRLFSRFCIGK